MDKTFESYMASKYAGYELNLKNHFFLLAKGEEVLWQSKPEKKPFIIGWKVRPIGLLATGLIFAFLGLLFLRVIISQAINEDMKLLFFTPIMFIPFILFWVCCGKRLFTAKKRYKNTEYVITNKRVIIKYGYFDSQTNSIFFNNITSVNLHEGIIDRKYNTKNVIISVIQSENIKTKYNDSIMAVKDAEVAYNLILKQKGESYAK